MEDELYGDRRGDELPEHLRTREGRRAALREAKEKLEQERAGKRDVKAQAPEEESSGREIVLDPVAIVAWVKGRKGWLREARSQLEEHRRVAAQPIPRGRAERLLEAERRMTENLSVGRVSTGRVVVAAGPAQGRRAHLVADRHASAFTTFLVSGLASLLGMRWHHADLMHGADHAKAASARLVTWQAIRSFDAALSTRRSDQWVKDGWLHLERDEHGLPVSIPAGYEPGPWRGEGRSAEQGMRHL